MLFRIALVAIAPAIFGCSSDTDTSDVDGTSTPDDPDVTVATLNVLHGIFCAPESDLCRLDDRLALAFDWIKFVGCPDVVTFQEVSDTVFRKLDPFAASTCPFPYFIERRRSNGVDDETVLSRYPLETVERVPLYGDFRGVLHARIKHPRGAVDVFTTHLASSVDKGGDACGLSCPPECAVAGLETKRDCQAVQLGDFVKKARDETRLAFITGDFNFAKDAFGYRYLTGIGWSDSHLAASNRECDSRTGAGCTSGRRGGLDSKDGTLRSRIDFVFVAPHSRPCELEAGGDPDGDATPTGTFADRPNPFADSCGASPAPVCWPSDHGGSVIDMNCR